MSGFQKGIRVATIAGIPIYLHVSWFVIFALVAWSLSQGYFPARYPNLPVGTYWAKGLVASLLLFASVLVHELGHSLVARRHGIGIVSITLFIFGGLAALEEDPRTAGAEFRVAAAGPAASLVLAGAFAALAAVAPPGSPAFAVAAYVAFLNLVLAVFNLIPAFPLDGGRILRAGLWGLWGRARATRVAAALGTGFAYLLILYGGFGLLTGAGLGGVWAILVGWFLKEASGAAGRQTELEEIFADISVGDLLVEECVTIPADTSLEQAVREFFMRHGHGGFPVVGDGQIVGLLSMPDVSAVPPAERSGTTAGEAMVPLSEETLVEADRDVLSALSRMARAGSGRLLVSREGRCVGMVTHSDILRRWRVGRVLGAA